MARELFRNLRKDLLVEFRSPSAFIVSIVFAAVSTLSIAMASGGVGFSPSVYSILLWMIIFFAAMAALSHIFVREMERGTDAFLMLSSSAETVYLSKLVFNCIYMLVLAAFILPCFLFFLSPPVFDYPLLVGNVAAGGIAIAAVSTVLGAMVARTGGKTAMFTVLSFPLIMPVLLVAIKLTEETFLKTATGGLKGILFLLAFCGFITAISLLLFRYIWMRD